MAPPLILASSSPRRLELLRQIGLAPDRIISPQIDETPLRGELPRASCTRLALAKLTAAKEALGSEGTHAFILSADTIAHCGRRLLGKPDNATQAEAHLRLLSGRAHHVCTSIAVRAPDGRVRDRLVSTRVRFKRFNDAELTAYLHSGEWQGRAGSYAVQGLAGRFVLAMSGSYGAIVGLPLYETHALLTGLGYSA